MTSTKFKALDQLYKLMKTMLVQMIRSDVSELTLRRYVMCSNFVLLHQPTITSPRIFKKRRATCFVRELNARLPITCSVAVFDVQLHLFKLTTEPELS